MSTEEIVITQEQADDLKASDLHRYVSFEFMTGLGEGPQQVSPGLRLLLERMLGLAAGALKQRVGVVCVRSLTGVEFRPLVR